jgi:hypothetical protein
MKTQIALASILALAALAACKSGDNKEAKSETKQQPAIKAGADDPWQKGGAKPGAADAAKDPDLAVMIDLAQNGPDREYPQADAVVALDRDDVTFGIDGALIEHHKSIVKILDAQRGKEKFADVHVEFDSKRQKLEIKIARTVNADGKPHTASTEEIGDIVPARLADATIYSDVRERVISFPAVDKGSVVELEWTRTTQATPDAPLGGELMLAQWDPVLDRTVTITASSQTPPKYAVDGIELKPTESSSVDGHVWTFHLAKQPDRHPEHSSPVDAAVLPRLVYGFQPSWSRVLAPVAERFLRAAVPQPMPDAIKKEADRVVAGAKTDAEKAQKLFAFVAHDIRSVDLPLGWAGYEPHAPEVVLANRYADQRDKVALLIALAASQNIPGRPVLVRSGRVPVIDTVPTIAQFDRVVAKLAVDGKDAWLDPIDESGRYDLVFVGQDNLVLSLDKGGKELGRRPALDPSTSVAHVTASYTLAANGDLDAKTTHEFTGYFADTAIEELRPLKGEHLDHRFQDEAAAVSAAAVAKEHSIGDLDAVTGTFQTKNHVVAPGYSTAQATFRVFELPPVRAHEPSVGLTARKYPLYVGTPRTERFDRSVAVPAGWKIAYVPPKLEGAAEGVAFTSECSAKGQTVACHDEIKLDKLVVPTDKYTAFRSVMTKLDAYERRIVLLVKA